MLDTPHQAKVRASLAEAAAALEAMRQDDVLLDTIALVGKRLGRSLAAGFRVFSCGNGGSMADAMHFAEELTGRFRSDRRPLAATAISDPTHLSCVANDFGWEYVFSRYIQAHGTAGDWLLAISTSGNSQNVLEAARVARGQGMTVIGLHARPGSMLSTLADYPICTPGLTPWADRAQELHIKVIHCLIEAVEMELGSLGA